MATKLPKHIAAAVRSNKTSLGDHPALPPGDELPFLEKLLSRRYTELVKKVGGEALNAKETQSRLNAAASKCREIESANKQDLENLVESVVSDAIDVPKDAVDVKVELKDLIDVSSERMFPEDAPDFTFEDLDDMRSITKEIYQRRFMDVLICGAAARYARNAEPYLSKVFEINPELPALYAKMNSLEDLLLMQFDDSKMSEKEMRSSGTVSVYIGNSDTQVRVRAEAMTFPTLLYETFKGFFEIAAAHGLPSDRKRAEYVTKKADFRYAEIWDQRLGLPLWEKVEDRVKEAGGDVEEVGAMYLIMEIAALEPDEFNDFMQETLSKTRRGADLMDGLIRKITKAKGQDDFDDFMQSKTDEYIGLVDSEYLSPDELITDAIDVDEL